MERLLTSSVSISNGNIKYPIGNSSQLPLLRLTLKVWSLSIHSFKNVCTIDASEVWTKSYGPSYTKFWAFWQKSGFIKPFLKTFLWLKQLLMLNTNLKTTIFQCSKNYGSPTRVTRLRVAPNMADPISL